MKCIEEMIKELCPEGVEKVAIGNICTNVFAGGTPSTKRDDYYDGDIPWIRSGEIDFNRIYRAERNITQKGLDESSAKMIRSGSVVMAMTGATVAKVSTVEIETSANQSVCAMECDSETLSYMFLYYVFAQNYLQIKSRAQGALTSLNLAMIKEIEIPLPPLEIQQKIVDTLDKFTSMIENIDEEIELRKKQYEEYREKLIARSDFPEGEEWELKTLGDVGIFVRGNGLQKKDFREEGYPCIHYGQVHTFYETSTTTTKSYCDFDLAKKLKKVPTGGLIIATTSEDVEACCKAVVWLGEGEVAYSGDSFGFIHDQNPKYMAYLFQTEMFAKQKRMGVTGAKVVRVSGDSMDKFEFPFPPLSRQHEIVDILDKFEATIANLKEERVLRQKQYEYYREKLLTF